MRRMRGMSVIAALSVLTLGLGACGNDADGTSEVSTPDTAPTTQQVVPEATTEPPTPPDTKYMSLIDLSNDAYKARLTVLTSDVLRPEPSMINGGMTLNQCEVNYDKDAVVAYTLSLQNTAKTDAPVEYMLNWDIDRGGLPGDADTSRVRIKTAFELGGETNCYDEFSSQTGGSFRAQADALGKDSTLDISGFFILQNFFTAKYPNGDFGSVKSARITLLQLVADSSTRLGWDEKDLGSMEDLNQNDYEYPFGARLVAKQQVGTA